MTVDDLALEPLPADSIGLLEGLTTTRSIRRYLDEPVPAAALRAMLFAASRAPSGSNRQPFRFLVLTDSAVAREAKALVGAGARRAWARKRAADGYDRGSGQVDDSPKARMGRAMQAYVDDFERAPVLVLPCLVRYRDPTPTEGASVYPACQNLLLAARALGYGGVLTMWHGLVEPRAARAARRARRTCSWPRRSRSAARQAITGRCAGARSTSSCSPTAGANRHRGPSIRPARASPAPVRRC